MRSGQSSRKARILRLPSLPAVEEEKEEEVSDDGGSDDLRCHRCSKGGC